MKNQFILSIFVILTSCASIFPKRAIKRSGVLDAKSEFRIIKNKKQEIVFVLMHHVGRKEYYDDVAHKIDSLQKLDYIVFYEGVVDNEKQDSSIRKKNLMKLRKLMEFFPQGYKGYIDTTTNVIAGKIKYKGKYKLVNQPRYNKLNVDSLTSFRADVSLTKLITAFEKNNKEIKLDSCDFKFSITAKDYPCKKAKRRLRKVFNREYVKDYRNNYLAEEIIESNKHKILVVYGNAHFYGLYFKLFALDNSYKITGI